MTEDQKTHMAQRLHFLLNRAADAFGRPLPPGLAMYMATQVVKDIPNLLDAIAEASEGKVQ